MILAMSGSLWFANESNAGKFFDRLPHFFDFTGQLIPRDGWEVWRALFDLPSPYVDGSLKYDYPEGRMYICSVRSTFRNISTRCWRPSILRSSPR